MGIRERLDQAAKMPHRKNATGHNDDTRLESTLGVYFYAGLIADYEFEAGVRYGKIILNYLQSIDAPIQYGRGFDDLSDDECFRRKIACSQVRQILREAAAVCKRPFRELLKAVDNLTVYGEAPSADEMELLHIGLRALAQGANVLPFARKSAALPGGIEAVK